MNYHQKDNFKIMCAFPSNLDDFQSADVTNAGFVAMIYVDVQY